MNIRKSTTAALMVLALLGTYRSDLYAQVVEGRDAEANPAAVIFRSTLYGAGTGLALGGAYALVSQGNDPSTGEVLRWGAAGGAAAGLLIGLLHLATRAEPEGSIGDPGILQIEGGDVGLSMAGALSTRVRELPGMPLRTLDVNLVRVGF